jgi:hypothetical protein
MSTKNKLSSQMKRVLRSAYDKEPLDRHCRTQSDHGGLTSTIFSLRRRGLLDMRLKLTAAGRAECKLLFGSGN